MDAESLANVLFWPSLIIAVLTIIDWLIGDKHRDWIQKKLEDLWLWLADRQFSSFIRILRSPSSLYTVTSVGVILFISLSYFLLFFLEKSHFTSGAILFADSLGNNLITLFLLHAISLIMSGYFLIKHVCFRYTKWLVSNFSIIKFATKYILSVITFLPIYFVFMLTLYYIFAPNEIIHGNVNTEEIIYLLKLKYGDFLYPFIIITIYCIVSPFIIIFWYLYIIHYFSLIWFITSFILLIIVRILQFVIIRVIGNNTGPVLGFSAVVIIVSFVLS